MGGENVTRAVEGHARPLVAAGAVFVDSAGRVLLVRPTYKDGWEIPGGYVEEGESPRDACAREILEELAIVVEPGRLLVVDWAPHPAEGDKILYVFDGGELRPQDQELIKLAPDELADCAFHTPDQLPTLLPPRLSRRVALAVDARAAGNTIYAEHGSSPKSSPLP